MNNALWFRCLPIDGRKQTLDFNLWFSEIDEQTNLQTAGAQIIQCLGGMIIYQRGNRFQLNQYSIFNEQVNVKVPNVDSIENNLNWMLLHHSQTRFVNYVCQRILVYFFNEANPKCIADLISTTNDFLCYLIYILMLQ